jgi:glutamate-ammonia-ligase adenylyltransferase
VSDAYREFRRLQHQIRMRGEERARVDPVTVDAMRTAVITLWQQIFSLS